MRKRVIFLLKSYLWTVLVFIIAKIAFMLDCHEAVPVLTIADVKDVVMHGLTLDLSTALYFLVVPFLTVVASIWWLNEQVTTRLLRVYYAFTATAFALAFVADASLYPFWGFKLDSSCLQYLSTPAEAASSVSAWYLLWRVLAIAVIAFIIFWGYQRCLHARPFAVRSGQPSTVRARLVATCCALLAVPLFVIGIRGGFGESTTNVGQVYFSQTQFLNHAAINPVFSFFASFEHNQKDYSGYDFFADEECNELLSAVYTTQSIGADSLLNCRRPNIVVILLESCGGQFMEIGGREDLMPNLNRIAREGVFFTQCYANSWRTDRGTVCTYSGWPSFPNVSIMKMPDKSRTMPSIAKTLKAEGYHTHYLYGGDINFTNMRSYLIGTGWEQLTSMDDFTPQEQKTARWGVRDDVTFNTLYGWMTQPLPSPYLVGFSTLSSHEPWDVPIHELDDEVENAFRYLDNCLGDFVNRLKQTAQWQQTLLIILPDHGRRDEHTDETMPLLSHIPMIWTGGAIRQATRIDKICNQSDLAATLLGQLALPHDDFPFSRDVLSDTYTYPTAVHNYNNAQSMVDSTGFILYDFDGQRLVVNQSTAAERMVNVSKAILQKTSNDLKNR